MNELFKRNYSDTIYGPWLQHLPELISVKIGLKPVFRTVLHNNEDYKDYKRICYMLSILPGISEYKIEKPYLAENILKDNNARGGDRFIYASNSQSLIDKAKELDLQDDFEFGKIMGYPLCCINHFENLSKRQCDHEMYNYVKSGKILDWRINYLLRWNSPYYLIAYKVCSFDCKKSIKIADTTYEELSRLLPDYAKRIKYHLNLPIIFDDSRLGNIYNHWDNLKAVALNGKITEDSPNNVVSSHFSCPLTIKYNGTLSLMKGCYFPDFERGNALRHDGKMMYVYKDNELINSFDVTNKKKGFIVQFE